MCIGDTLRITVHVPLSTSFLEAIHLIVSCCVAGSGMGAAAVFERGDGVDQLSNARQVISNN